MGQHGRRRWLVGTSAAASGAVIVAVAAAIATGPASGKTAGTNAVHPAGVPGPAALVSASRIRPRQGAARRGTTVPAAALFTARVFPHGATGFALANDGSAQYPAITTDGGRVWRIAGPQFHVDAADGPEGVGFVGSSLSGALFAYGSSVVDVTTDRGRTWWEAFLGENVSAVSETPGGRLVAYVEQQTASEGEQGVTWQYVSRDGGRHWRYSTSAIN